MSHRESGQSLVEVLVTVVVAASTVVPGLAQVAQTPVDGVDLHEPRVRPVLERR